MGLAVSINALFLTQESENAADITDVDEEEDTSFIKASKAAYHKIKNAVQMPEIYQILIYFILTGIMTPDFSSFKYYFLLNTVKLSPLEYSYISILAMVTGILGTMIYGHWLKHVEVRTITMWSIVLFCINGITDYLFVIGYTAKIGLSDRNYIYGSIIVFGIVGNAISFLPIMALFAKIIPAKIEGTMFAFLTGISNLSSTIISSQIGYFINERFFNVTSKNMTHYKYLVLVTMVTNFLGFLILRLIPTSKEIENW